MINQKRILIVLNSAWNIYNFRLPLMRFLRDEGYTVIAIAPKDGYETKIEAEGFQFYHLNLSSKGINPFSDLRTLWQLYKFYRAFSPFCILHYTVKPNIYGSIAAFIAGVKSIATVTGLGTLFISKSFAFTIGRFLYYIAFKFTNKIFFQNHDDLQLFLHMGLASKNKVSVIPGSGIDTSFFAPIKEDLQERPFIFLLIARMLWDKGIGEFVEASTILKDKGYKCQFWLLGDSNANNRSVIPKETIQNWEKKEIIKYIEPTDDVRTYISKAHCIVLPSYREGLPRTLLEAASMEKPLIATNVPGCKDVIENGLNGFLCEVKNSNDLAKAMLKMYYLTKVEKMEMGKYSRLKVCREFDETLVFAHYLSTIEKITQN